MILRSDMSQKQKEWLVNYLISNNFEVVGNSEHLADKITGMMAQEIIAAMEEAKIISDRLNSTALGKELN